MRNQKNLKTMARLLALLLVCLVAFSACNEDPGQTVTPPDGETESESATEELAETQTEASDVPWMTIETAEQLVSMALNGKYTLAADLDLGGMEWIPVGSASAPFSGIFNGNGHTISNFKITASHEYAGFFGYNRGTVENVTLEDFSIRATNETTTYTGGLVGWNDGTVEQAHVRGQIAISSAYDVYAGGLIGTNQGEVIGCDAKGTLSFAYLEGEGVRNGRIGGLVGRSGSGSVADSYADCNVTVEGNGYVSGAIEAGGLIGYNSNSTLTQCHATGEVQIRADFRAVYAGGLLGRDYRGVINSAYTTGKVTVSNNPSAVLLDSTLYVGGFIGNDSQGLIRDCYTTAPVEVNSYSEKMYTGGLLGYHSAGSSAGEVKNCYATGNVTTNMKMNNGSVWSGSFVGYSVAGLYDFAYTTGNVSFTSDYLFNTLNIGWLFGYAEGNGRLQDVYYSDQMKIAITKQSMTTDQPTHYLLGRAEALTNLQSPAFQQEKLSFSPDVWNLTSGQNPTLK